MINGSMEIARKLFHLLVYLLNLFASPLVNGSLFVEFFLSVEEDRAAASNAFFLAFTSLSSRSIKNALACSTSDSTSSCFDRN